MALGRNAVLTLAAIPAVGCILLVHPPETGAHCTFRGEDTACGACLTARCRAEIDAACADDAVLSAMEECAATGDDACGRVPASDVATCMKANCPAICYTRVGVSATHCSDAFLAPGLACSCDVDGTPNDLACTSDVYPRTLCCAPAGWPGPALECACKAFGCFPTSDGCSCILTDNLEADTATDCHGAHCCAIDDRCQCRRAACSGNEREVAACTRDRITCPLGASEVAACAIRR